MCLFAEPINIAKQMKTKKLSSLNAFLTIVL